MVKSVGSSLVLQVTCHVVGFQAIHMAENPCSPRFKQFDLASGYGLTHIE
jgi:hypothetical protein